MVEQSNKGNPVPLAWYDQAFPDRYTTPKDKQEKGQKEADSLPKGSIGRMYLAGSAAMTWACFDPEALKGSVNGVQDYGDPIAGITALLKEWGAKEGSSKKGDSTKGKNSDNGSAAKSSGSKKNKDKDNNKSKNNSGGGEGSPEASNNNKDSKKEKMIKYAQDKIGKAKYSQGLRAQAPDYYDCSSLVWFAMKEAGFNVPETIWTTYVMEDDANGPHKYLEKISNSEAKRGKILPLDIIYINKIS